MAAAAQNSFGAAVRDMTARMNFALDGVRFNSQAVMAATTCLNAAAIARTSLESFPADLAASAAAEQVREVAEDVWRYSKPFQGLRVDAPVSLPSWTELRKAIQRCYGLLFAIDRTLPPEVRETFASAAASIATESARAVPMILKETIAGAGEVIGAAGAGVGAGLGNIIKGAWPLLLAAVAVLAGAVYLASTGGASRLRGGA